jgi:formylglycine-generating enzyme required for sulfatase activity
MTELPFTHIIPGMASSELVLVEGGTFMMGSDEYGSEKPIHKVTLPSFGIGKYPVTQELWMAVMGENPSRFVDPKRPVERVSLEDMQAFFQKINQVTRLSPDWVFRLPTEAEWEYAAKGGNKSGGFRYAGGDKLDELGWYDNNSHGGTKPVGLKLANELGIYDLSGNVMEWCVNHWAGNYDYAYRVPRGGGWYSDPIICRLSNHHLIPDSLLSSKGFRVVLGSPPGS